MTGIAISDADALVYALKDCVSGGKASEWIAPNFGFLFPGHQPRVEMTETQYRALRSLFDHEQLVHLYFPVFYVAIHAHHAVAGRFTPVLVDNSAVEFTAVVA